MNTNAEIGSSWNGRILLKIDFKNTDTPVTNVKDIKGPDEEIISLANNVRRNIAWEVRAKLYCAYYLPKE